MIRSKRGIDYQDVPRPVAALSDEYSAGFLDPRHKHSRAQLIYASAGVMSVTTDEISAVVPPYRAVWVPGGVYHEVRCQSAVSVRTVYVDSSAHPDLPASCRVLEVSTLLRELIIEATVVPVEYDEDGRDGRVMALLLDEIASTPVAPLHIPMPRHERLLAVCRSIITDPGYWGTVDEWAEMARMSRRTFTRHFRKETGMSFSEWQQHVRLMDALSKLANGEQVTQVAFDVGYKSASAFTAMFHRTFGAPPLHYFNRKEREEA
ncbi:AraC-like DNA-binding protein [Natronospira proteinivora]|uniref:AraC-like DNA-binding protein n=1 Tax=Natronospira proteinivora TaxID=1807133 RepID=A0ABT1G8H0_9GAMM|nr:helix-turn-helix transcriptional regulator [Natronospira proteinivora]MCP1727590.1 AraC-like DNA-binding protein [Natronospira proteinivora]